MDTRKIYSVQVRKEGSEKVLIYIDKLNEQEADVVFKQFRFASKGEGFEKVLVFDRDDEVLITRRQSLK